MDGVVTCIDSILGFLVCEGRSLSLIGQIKDFSAYAESNVDRASGVSLQELDEGELPA
jgi:hypothetical protein